MPYGVITYTPDGLPVCEICGQAFHRLLRHVAQAHKISARDYKKQYGLDSRKGICSRQSAAKTSWGTLKNYDACVTRPLLEAGAAARFKKGHTGRTKEQISEQSRLRISRLGLSGTGNAAKAQRKNNPPER